MPRISISLKSMSCMKRTIGRCSGVAGVKASMATIASELRSATASVPVVAGSRRKR